MKHVIRPAAKDDIVRQFRYYLQENAPEAAIQFLDVVDEFIAAIRQMPYIGARKILENPVLAELRSWPVKGFEGARDINRILDRESNSQGNH